MRFPPPSRSGVIATYAAAFAVFVPIVAVSYVGARWLWSRADISVNTNGGAIFDLSPLSSFFDLTVVNDTGTTVWIDSCADVRCLNRDGEHDTLKPGASRDTAAWDSVDSGGIAAVAVFTSSGERCLRVRYRRGQEKGLAYVSAASGC